MDGRGWAGVRPRGFAPDGSLIHVVAALFPDAGAGSRRPDHLARQGIEAVLDLSGAGEIHPLRYASLVASVIGMVLVPLANFFWRRVWRWFPAIERLTFTDLNGTWEGHITTMWKSPDTGEPPEPFPVTVQVTQSLFSTAIRFTTKEATSYSTRCSLQADRASGAFRLLYSYEHRPTARVRPRSPGHDGSAWLEMHLAADRDTLVGQYFTDRMTVGDIKLCRVSTGT